MMFSPSSVYSSSATNDISKMPGHLKFILIWILRIPQLTDGVSVTWFEPPPLKSSSDPKEVLAPVTFQFYEGSPATLNWRYSLTAGTISLVFLKFDGVGIVNFQNGKPGQVNNDFKERFGVNFTSGSASLFISPVTAADDKDAGKFTCELITSSAAVWIRTIQLQVRAPAKVVNITGDPTILEGGNLQLTCEASGRPEPNITWTKRGYTGVVQEGKLLIIPNINRNDSGTFNCTAYNSFGEPSSQTASVNVIYPAKIVKLQAEHFVSLEQSVTLNCAAEGNPPPTYTWTPCISGQVCNKSTLDFPKVCNDGSYTCKVANILGNNSKTADVYVGGNVINITITLKAEACKGRLNTTSSVEEAFKKQLGDVFADKPSYEGMQTKDLVCLSKTVTLELNFHSPTKEKDVIATLENAIDKQSGQLGEFSVSDIKGRKCKGTQTDEMTVPAPTPSSEEFKSWLIILIVALGLLFLVLVGNICCWCFSTTICIVVVIQCIRKCICKENQDSKEVHTSGGQEMEIEAGYVDNQYAAAGPNAHGAFNPASLPPANKEVTGWRSEGRRGNGTSEPKEPLPEYAVVDKTKKKKKTPKPGELQYAELGDLTGRGKKATLPPVGGTSTVYAEVN